LRADPKTPYNKVKILDRIQKQKYYTTIGHMMEQEKNNGIINYEYLDEANPRINPSGSRTLLRLHRALKMVSLILRNIANGKYGEKLSTIVKESYNGSPLPAHHPWVSHKSRVYPPGIPRVYLFTPIFGFFTPIFSKKSFSKFQNLV